MRPDKLVVIGQGYVGLPLAMRAVDAGLNVVGLDLDISRIKRLAAAESFVEDVSGDRIAAALATGRYLPSSDYADAEGFDVCLSVCRLRYATGYPTSPSSSAPGRASDPTCAAGAP